MKQLHAEEVAQKTQQTYNNVAGEFSASRNEFWDELAFLAEHAKRDDRVLDIGCGNGRLFPLITREHASYVGLDYSQGLIDEAEKRYLPGEFIFGDATALPFAENSFDIAFSFAVIHHLPSKEKRVQFVKEAARVLHPGGTLILSAWELWTRRHFGQLLFTALRSILRLTPLDIGDIMLTFGKKKSERYLHAFTERELSALLSENGFHVIDVDTIARKSGEENIVVIAKKI